KLHNETDEAVTIIRLNRAVPLGGITDIREALKLTLIGSTLSATECLNIGTTIYGGRQTKNFIDDMEEDLPLLKDYEIGRASCRERVEECEETEIVARRRR